MANSELDKSRFREVIPTFDVFDRYVDELKSHIVGQDRALEALASEIVIAEADMNDPTKPRGVFMFLGPTGVGKTETTEALAKILYGHVWEKHYKRIDCGVISGHDGSNKLTGSGPGWVGYGDPPLITEDFLSQTGGTITVFDEIEKANHSVFETLLSVTDKAKLTVYVPSTENQVANPYNKKVVPIQLNFNNSIIILTSNAGAEEMQSIIRKRTLGFQIGTQNSIDITTAGIRGLKDKFSNIPEFLGRIGENRIIVFKPLEYEHYMQIFDIVLDSINQRISGKIFVGDLLKKMIIEDAVRTGEYGARDLKQAMNQSLVRSVAILRLSKTIRYTTEVLLDLDADGKFHYFEGDEILPEPVKLEEKVSKVIPSETRSISIAPSIPFKLNLSTPEKDLIEYVPPRFQLVHNGNSLGMVRLREVPLESQAISLRFVSETQFYTIQFDLYNIVKAAHPDIELHFENKIYRPEMQFVNKRAGVYTMKVVTWKQDNEPTGKQLLFTLNDLKQTTFVIQVS